MSETRIKFSESLPGAISYVVIGVRHDGKWLFIKHRERGGFELPAGHPEEGESPEVAAARELSEETGAENFILIPVSYYSVISKTGTMHGKLFFADVSSFGEIKDKSEVESIIFSDEMPENVSLPQVMKALFVRLKDFLTH